MLVFTSMFRALVSVALLLSITLMGSARIQAQVAAAPAHPVSVQVAEPGAVSGQGWALFGCLGCAALFVAGTTGAILPTAIAILANPTSAKACALVCGVAVAEMLE